MRILSLQLNNIRSYTHTKVEFNEGITLLAGDIGAGKSTILLAIEFALFGIRRGGLGGEALLRHGESTGTVTLTFQTDHTYTITREIKRQASGVRQQTGSLQVNNDAPESLSAQELKARILQILGYPESLLNKSKGFVYRYTVYTPQEEMKDILTESDADRLDTLRAVFDVDRYKYIQENAQLLAKDLRDKRNYLHGRLEDVEQLEAKHEELTQTLQTLQLQVDTKEQAHRESATALDAIKEEGKRIEEQARKDQERKEQLATAKTQLQNATVRIKELEEEIKKALPEAPVEVANPQKQLEKCRQLESQIQEKFVAIESKLQALKQQQDEKQSAAASISTIDICPTCKQHVTEDHKHDIQEEVQKLKDVHERTQRELQEKKQLLTQKQQQIEAKRKQLETQQTQFTKYQAVLEQRKQQETRKEKLQQQLQALQTQQQSLNEQVNLLSKSDFKEETHRDYIVRKERAQREERNAHEQLTVTKTQLAATKKQAEELQVTLKGKHAQKKELKTVKSQATWVADALVPTAAQAEKHVLARIHQEFNERFIRWFQELLEDDAIFAQLNGQFAPEITQNGYDIDVQHLSGGEKTSVALAYRLALNSVLNDVLSTLKTTDLLILDEPTDGFSSEQLDRVRAVLEQVGAKQIILVSHEDKLESFVDAVIRVHKREHTSVVSS